jgi:hypothetical protein
MHIKNLPGIQNTKQSGFSTVFVIVSIVLIAGLAIAGLTVWHNSSSANKASTNSGQNTPEVSKETREQPVDSSEGGKYAVIKEWGLRFPMPDGETADSIQYELDESPTTEAGIMGRSVKFTSRKLTEATPAVCKITKNSWGGTQNALEVGLTASEGYDLDHGEFYVAIGKINNYYWYKSKQSTPGINCATNTPLQQTVDLLEKSYFNNLTKLEKIN